MNKRSVGILLLSLVMISMISSFALGALSDDARYITYEGTSVVVEALRGVASALPIWGDYNLNLYLTRFFLAILLFTIVYTIVRDMFKTKWTTWVISGAISILALIAIPQNLIGIITTQYGVMGATILTVIPFLIILVFSLRTRSLLAARVTWVVWFMYYFSMYIYGAAVYASLFEPEIIPYIGAIIVGLFMLFGIKFFRDLVFKGEIEKIEETGVHHIEEGKLLKKLKKKELEEVYGSP